VVFTNDGKRKKIDTRIDKVNAVLCELNRTVLTNQELSNTAKLSVFKSVFVPIFIHSHESWVMIERLLSQVKAAKMGISKISRCDRFATK